MSNPAPYILPDLLNYDPETGKLFWRKRPLLFFGDAPEWRRWNTRYAGREAFTAVDTHGYRHGSIFGKLYLAHRVIWAMQTGEWPGHDIDHENTNRLDNRWVNLRKSSDGANAKNRRRSRANSSGVTGVHFDAASGKWRAQIIIGGVNTHLGLFTDLSEAAQARKLAETRLGYHPSHGELRT